MRLAKFDRQTAETRIAGSLNLDGTGQYQCQTGVGFFDHMLEQFAQHSLFDLTLKAKGDLHIDDHHTIEDCGIALGCALREALGEKRGIVRYGAFDLVMDDARISTALDLSGRAYFVYGVRFPTDRIGRFDVELVREFLQAFATNSAMTLHIDMVRGENSHHIAEACFKSIARALRCAVSQDPFKKDAIPSTKGIL